VSSSPDGFVALDRVDQSSSIHLLRTTMQRAIRTALLSFVPLFALGAIQPVVAQSVQTGFAPVHNGRLYYEMSGSGDAVVFVHGNLGDRRHWDLQFEAFAKRFKTVRYDVRGFGRSSLPKEAEPYSHYKDLEVLLDDLGIKGAHLVGWSMGSGIVVDFAMALPERTRSLVTVGPWVFGYSSPATQEIFDGMRQVQAALAAGGPTAGVEAWMSSPFFHKTIVDPAAGKRFRAIADDYTFWHFAHADPQGTLQSNAAGRVADIRVPTLIVAGERDLAACLELADVLAKSVPGSRKVVVAGAGHMVHMDKPEEFNEIVSAFVSSVTTPAPR
jgi:pimeloyl-ACP methyl ester carboxylesterase